jgi:hypothetical protein
MDITSNASKRKTKIGINNSSNINSGIFGL